MTLEGLAVVLTVVFAAALLRTSVGFGDALFAMPLLSFVIDVKVAAPLVASTSATIAIVVLWRESSQIHVRSAWWLVLFSLLGIPLGIGYLTQIDERFIKGVLAVLVIAFATYSLCGPRLPELTTDRLAGVFGFVSGVLGGAYNTAGPPVVIYGTLRRWNAASFVATLQGYFLSISLLVLGAHYFAGLWTQQVLSLYVWSLPLVLIAVLAGSRLRHSVSNRRFVPIVHVFLIITGLALLADCIGHIS